MHYKCRNTTHFNKLSDYDMSLLDTAQSTLNKIK